MKPWPCTLYYPPAPDHNSPCHEIAKFQPISCQLTAETQTDKTAFLFWKFYNLLEMKSYKVDLAIFHSILNIDILIMENYCNDQYKQPLPPCINYPRYSFRNRIIYFSWLRFSTKILRNQKMKMDIAPQLIFLSAFKSKDEITSRRYSEWSQLKDY